MKLIILYSPINMVVRLINIETHNSEGSSDRDLDTWMVSKGKNLRWSYWKNRVKSEENSYKYNRVNFHYTNEENKTITKSYYCIVKVIRVNEMTFQGFDTTNFISLLK